MDALRGFTSRGYTLHDKRCACRGITCGKHLGYGTLLVTVDLDVAALVFLHSKLFEQTLGYRIGEAHGKQHELGGYYLLLAGVDEIHAASLRIFLPAHLLDFHLVDMSVLADELAGVKQPAACTSLFVAARSLRIIGK